MYLDESGRKIEEGKKNVKSGNCDIELSTSFFFFFIRRGSTTLATFAQRHPCKTDAAAHRREVTEWNGVFYRDGQFAMKENVLLLLSSPFFLVLGI